MFRIEYKIITEQFEGIGQISDEDILYSFLLGNVSLLSTNAEIEMKWEWIPLLDFAYCLRIIVNSLKVKDTVKEYFEFTENAETLEFSKHEEQVKILASFSYAVLETIFSDFEKATYDFHSSISEYVRLNTLSFLPMVLRKYLSA